MIYNWHRQQKEQLKAGDRAADAMRNGMGSWPFVFLFILFMGVWALLNTLSPIMHWDPYPFILLNLFLSMLAALQGAILLIAAKRQDSISAAMAKHDYETNLRAKREIEALTRLNEHQLEIMNSLHISLVGQVFSPNLSDEEAVKLTLSSPQTQSDNLAK